MDGLKGEYEDFELNPVMNRKLMELLQDGGDVVMIRAAEL